MASEPTTLPAPALAATASGREGRPAAPPGEPRRIGYLYIAPAIAFYAAFVLVPFLHSIWLSFFQWDGVTPGTWVGLGNYRDILSDPTIRSAFLHSIVL